MMTQSLSDVVVFDLDDTLYKEVSFVESGFKAVALHVGDISFAKKLVAWWSEGKNALEFLINKYALQFSINELLYVYRNHFPAISLDESTTFVLDYLTDKGKIMGLITDGRLKTQRNKIKALGLSRWIAEENIIVSEEFGTAKPDSENYRFFMTKYPGKTYAYIGDNIAKDFIAPKSLGWQTICLKNNGQNIHTQNLSASEEYLPNHTITNILEIKDWI